ncbi:glycerate kinase [Atopobacter phocae]|uniref:glycerate kinase family protein n=1 Tax=Atopobacter phocae TaxID=136492 RepID=UPI00046EE5A3|nr:glycerate kinase [Atopobacter phocae]
MKIVAAIDSFKGSLSSLAAGQAVAESIHRVEPDAEVVICPLADGGEGTVDALVHGMNGILKNVSVTGPLGHSVTAQYGIIPPHNIAVIEMSSAAGLTLVPTEQRHPFNTTTYGVGELIKHAIQEGCRRFIIGIGGSATNDGGVGMLQALGYEFLDEQAAPISLGAIGLKDLATIRTNHAIPELASCEFRIACDVNNELYGTNGASAVYGPQKGASAEMVKQMDSWLKHYAQIAQETVPSADPLFPGTGAAGGLGFAFLTFLNASLESGITIILEETKLEAHLKDADLVFTGEGKLDAQTTMGKAPIGVARLAKKHHLPVVAVAGIVTEEAYQCTHHGIDAIFPILREIVTVDDAIQIDYAKKNLSYTSEQIFRLWRSK